MKIILFLFGIILGFTLSFSSKFLPEKKTDGRGRS